MLAGMPSCQHLRICILTHHSLFIDVVLVIMPLPTIWKLKASRGRKWGLTIVMLIGIGALIASAIRLSVYNTHSAKYLAPSYTNIMIMWLVIEPSIYLIAACLPAMHVSTYSGNRHIHPPPHTVRLWRDAEY